MESFPEYIHIHNPLAPQWREGTGVKNTGSDPLEGSSLSSQPSGVRPGLLQSEHSLQLSGNSCFSQIL